jgi:adenylate cyclase
MEFTVIGDRVNVASRLTAMAGPGDIVAGEPTYERVQELFGARPIGTVMLRGKARPVRAFLIQGPRG